MTIIYRIFAVFGHLFKTFRFTFKIVTTGIIAVLFIGSLFINIAMLTWAGGAMAISAAVNTVTGATTVISKLQADNAKLNTKLKSTQGIAKKTRKQFVRRTVKVAVISAGSAALGWFPFVGQAADASAIVYDLHHACETIKDLNAINVAVGNDVKSDDADDFIDKYCTHPDPNAKPKEPFYKRWWKKLPFTKN